MSQLDLTFTPASQRAIGGGLEGAAVTSRETFSWNPAVISPDQQINQGKTLSDARGRDAVQNDGYATGVVNTHRDSIVGSQYRLNAKPVFELVGGDEDWAEEFQLVVENRFNLLADSAECWFDASGTKTLTDIIRLAIGGFVFTGEVLGTAEWLSKQPGRPFNTAFQMVAPIRLSNPNGLSDTEQLSGGVAMDAFGNPVGYHIRRCFPTDFFNPLLNEWKYIPAKKPWGRRQVIHIREQLQPGQTRGVADMVSVLKQMRMTKKFQDITLQNAVVNASYAAAIESELPREAVYQSLGSGSDGIGELLGGYMTALNSYVSASDNIAVDGVKIPHLFPGTKLNFKPMGTPGGVGTAFEESLLRHVAAALGMSYEQFSRDYSKTNYSSARASMAETWKFMQSRKKLVADRLATSIYTLWLEEEINAGHIPLPKGKTAAMFYDPVMREALVNCTWIGASRGQIDELKETQSALLRIKSGLSTLEIESARLGEDFRTLLRQRAREEKMLQKYGLHLDMGAEKPGANERQKLMREEKETDDE